MQNTKNKAIRIAEFRAIMSNAVSRNIPERVVYAHGGYDSKHNT